MIRVTVELIPFGIGKPVVIGRGVIINDGTGTSTRGSYDFSFTGKKSWSRQGSIFNFPRKSANVWQLIARCLAEGGIK